MEVQRWQDFINDFVHTRVLQADRVQHSHRCFANAMGWIASARFASGSFQNDGTGIAIVKSFNARVFLAKADTARKQHNR